MLKEFVNPIKGAHSPTISLYFDAESSDPVCQTLAAGKVWSADLAALSSLFWKPGANIVDVGTHIGTFSTLAAAYTTGKVYSIEPDPTNFANLVRNKEENEFDNQICLNYAASNQDGVVNFCSAGPGSHIQADGWGDKTVEVVAKTVDSLLEGIKVDFVKIDVEGWELNVIEGMKTILENDKPPVAFEVNGFCLQWFEKTPNDLLRAFEDFGYRVFAMHQRLIPINSHEPFPFGVVDCFALQDEQLAQVMNYLTLPLSEKARKEILDGSNYYANVDMQRYFRWYREKLNLPPFSASVADEHEQSPDSPPSNS